jgi:hypothetical protein
MTRKNQICEAGQQYLDSMDEFQRYHTYPREAFIDGAKWADEHPNPAMINKQEFIAKVKRWLELETDWNMEYDEEGRNLNYGKIDELVKYLE